MDEPVLVLVLVKVWKISIFSQWAKNLNKTVILRSFNLCIEVKHPVFELDDNQKLLKLDADLTQDRFGGGKCSIAILDALNAAFFQEMGFRGNTANYYNPANSFIDKVNTYNIDMNYR